MKTTLAAAMVIALSAPASSQSLSIDNNGKIIGPPIHRSEHFVYYRCADVVSDNSFIQNAFEILGKMSTQYKVPPPRDKNCVLSQSFLLGNSIQIQFAVDQDNASCFYRNFCNDWRTVAFLPGEQGIDLLFNVVNAATKTTEFWCLSSSQGFNMRHCRE